MNVVDCREMRASIIYYLFDENTILSELELGPHMIYHQLGKVWNGL